MRVTNAKNNDSAEHIRLARIAQSAVHWKRWGPYLSERAWGNVREDDTPHGTAWEHLPHDAARSKAYRWNDDGLAKRNAAGDELPPTVAGI